jgi:hypothetical protein
MSRHQRNVTLSVHLRPALELQVKNWFH